MIFGNLELEKIVQVDDRTRINANKSYITPGEAAISLMEIEPEAGNGFLDVTSEKYLDWQYSGVSRTASVTVRITTDGAPVTFSKDIEILTAEDDKLFSEDSELVPYEPNILNWVQQGRNSYKNIHRAAQDRILAYLDENAFWDENGNKLTKEDIVDISEFEEWSKFMVLRLIFEGVSNATDDIFHEKALRYKELEFRARDRAIIRVDTNNDGDNDDNKDVIDLRSIEMIKV